MISQNNITSITGAGIVSPAGLSIDHLWEACLANKVLTENGLGKVEQEHCEAIVNYVNSSEFIVSKPAYFSKALYFSLFAIISAMENANWDKLNETDALFIGTTTGMLTTWEGDFIEYMKTSKITHQFRNNFEKHNLGFLGDEIRRSLGFTGKIVINTSACSASTQAFADAHNWLVTSQCERCLVGGVEELGQLTIRGFKSLKLLIDQPCVPFDQNRSGINLSEGAAFYTLEKQKETSRADLLGGNTYLDSYHMTSPHPEAYGLCQAIEKTLKKSEIEKKQIDLIHAHGTGSPHNDQAEAYGVKNVFGNSTPTISTKGTHGHALAASGSFEIGLCLKILETNTIPAITGLRTPDKEFSIKLPQETIHKKITYLMKTTLGFGGVNCTLLLRGNLSC